MCSDNNSFCHNELDGVPSEAKIQRLVANLRPVIIRTIDSMRQKNLLQDCDNPIDLLDRTLRYLKMYLRSLDACVKSTLSEKAMTALLSLKAVKLLLTEDSTENCTAPEEVGFKHTIEHTSEYEIKSSSRPKYHVGGDLIRIHVTTDGCVWVLLADVAGKSVSAHLTAKSFDLLWEIAMDSLSCEPLDVLQQFDRELQSCLPDGVFVETALTSATTQGDVSIAAAGYVQLLVGDQANKSVDVIKLGGMFLGTGYPEMFSSQRRKMVCGGELLFASDGLFDQRGTEGPLRNDLPNLLKQFLGTHRLHEAVIAVLSESLKENIQFDDISVVSLFRLPERVESGTE